MALTMEAPETLDDEVREDADQPTVAESISVDEANAELTEVGRETQNEIGQDAADAQADQVVEVDEEEKRFWATIAIKGKLADCGRDIREAESKIDHLKMLIKEEKEFLKGEQIRLTRLAGDLADIIDGHPLPKDPNVPEPKAEQDSDGQADAGNDNAPNWRVIETGQLLYGVKGLGAKKLEAMVDLAPTAGDLEDLRGEASKAHEQFREKLPSGFGQKIADAIEDRLIEHVAKCSPSAEDQAAEERSNTEESDDEESRDGMADGFADAEAAEQIKKREHDQVHAKDADEYEDVEDEAI